MNDLVLTDQQRLAHIRMEVEKWAALLPESASWDSAFLLRVIDQIVKGRSTT